MTLSRRGKMAGHHGPGCPRPGRVGAQRSPESGCPKRPLSVTMRARWPPAASDPRGARGRRSVPRVRVRERRVGFGGGVRGPIPQGHASGGRARAGESGGTGRGHPGRASGPAGRQYRRCAQDRHLPGTGPARELGGVAAIRLAISRGRAESAERRLRERMGDDALGSNPELLLLKGEIRRELQAAVKEALGRLEERERLVMRLWLSAGRRWPTSERPSA